MQRNWESDCEINESEGTETKEIKDTGSTDVSTKKPVMPYFILLLLNNMKIKIQKWSQKVAGSSS